MNSMIKRITAAVLALVLICGSLSAVKPVTVKAADEWADTSDYESLKEIYAPYFKMGVAVQAISHWGSMTANAEIGNANKEKLINEQFNSMTFGNELKPAYNFSATTEGLFKVDRAAEELLDWAKANNMPVRGHTLVWHSQVNPAIFAKDFNATVNGSKTTDETATLDEDCLVDRDTLLERLKTYIYSVIEYTYAKGYADIIYAWDVVNEASDESNSDGLRRSYWYRIIGDDFLYYCFLYAREAENLFAEKYAADYGLDPSGDLSSIKAELFYNDYNEWYTGRCDYIIDFLTTRVYNEGQSKVKSSAIKADGDGTIFGDGLIDGIGMQGHLTDTQSIVQYRTALEKYSDAVGNVHITELDVGKSVAGDAGEFKQAKFYYDFFSMLVEEVKAGYKLTSVTLWGLTDTSSWRADSEPLIFYKYLGCKPAFFATVMAGKGEEFTLVDASTVKEAVDVLIDFEPVKSENGSSTPADPKKLGFSSRGTGHQATFMLSTNPNHTKVEKMGYSLKASRKAEDATVRYEASHYIGHTLKITAYVQTKDSVIRMGFDADGEAKQCIEVPSVSGDFTELSFYYTLDESLKGADLYFETDGTQTMFIDDVSIELWDDKEQTPITLSNPSDTQAPDAGTDAAVTEAPSETSGTTETAATEAPASTPADSSSETSEGSSRTTIVIIILAVAAVVIAAAVVLKKKK